ncbi:adenylate/guanylate cyclase domain-containing protein [Variovorax sp. J22P240]|uniref:adenylate/guanylate cyclase domain-containing protein n=1 Tax=Variovorax sp. J22P240 TaxID=3053514 RepID=UPI002577BFA5|nr:tetratricopeptide repeat protein [Variovorax sp. J22P240]MDM0000735.1 adenylate/guanylate cyclase domain-containing protein [Variovorax sp. J22P240]
MHQGDVCLRLVAILAADAEGYARLMADDHLGTLRELEAARAIFRAHIEGQGGRVVDTAGDSILAVFDSAGGAIAAAIAVQDALNERADGALDGRRLAFRIGIHLGDVIEKPDGTVYGDGVNVAARLQALAAPGGIALSSAVRGATTRGSDIDMEDAGEHLFKNIAMPVRVFRFTRAALNRASLPPLGGSPSLSVLVLPFVEPQASEQQAYFADAVTDDITTELSKLRGSYVIGSSTAMSLKKQRIDVRGAAREFGVRYVLQGRIERTSADIELNAQLSDAATGGIVWSDRISTSQADLRALRREVVARLANALGIQLVVAEGMRTKRERPTNAMAADLVMQARSGGGLAWEQQDYRRSLGLIDRALTIDPDNAEALVWRGALLVTQADSWPGPESDEQIEQADEVLSRAMALNSPDPWAQEMVSRLRHLQFRPSAAAAAAETAFELSSNSARLHAWLGALQVYGGHCEQAHPHLERALALSPLDPHRWAWYLFKGMATLLAGDSVAAAPWLEKSLNVLPRYWASVSFLSSAYANSGQIRQAQSLIATVREEAKVRRRFSRVANNPVWLKQLRDFYLEGLVRCGEVTRESADDFISAKRRMAEESGTEVNLKSPPP